MRMSVRENAKRRENESVKTESVIVIPESVVTATAPVHELSVNRLRNHQDLSAVVESVRHLKLSSRKERLKNPESLRNPGNHRRSRVDRHELKNQQRVRESLNGSVRRSEK
jgi:hypothetical protein